ncbi:hypothetical protein AVEN_112087-1 [Araneus ventricosus]|uniref:Uncharacterized protein n=1 Tax=Araneus ventricosus TaxID=182803 RepID=A0A4Y2NYH2_ARAVE|nr:hypothetical protein AVEN_112087-1 [Araneus ventricosus]
MIPENATLFSIFLLGNGIHEKTPCDITACRREYLRTALRSEERLLSTGITLEHECLWSSTRSASWYVRGRGAEESFVNSAEGKTRARFEPGVNMWEKDA